MCASPCRGTIGDSRQIKADSVLCTCMCVYACFVCLCARVVKKDFMHLCCTDMYHMTAMRDIMLCGFPQKTGEELMLVAYDLIVP